MTSSTQKPSVRALLTHDHAEVGELFDKLYAVLDAGDQRRAFALLDLLWARLAVHIRAEHLCLFPAILDALAAARPEDRVDSSLTSEEAHAVIARLREDHNFFMNELSSAMQIMRELQAAPDKETESPRLPDVRQRVAAVGSRLALHNKLEEELVYGWPVKLLNPKEQARLMIGARGEIENLPQRFDAPHLFDD